MLEHSSPPSSSMPNRSSAAAELPLQLLPHQGRVLIDCSPQSGPTFLIHTVTLERYLLPDGRWEAVYDSDGFAALGNLDDDDAAPIVLEDSLRRQLYLEDGCVLRVIERVPDGRVQSWSLTNKMQHYTELGVVSHHGPLFLSNRWTVYLLSWPRMGFHFFWCTNDIYKALQLKTYQGIPSKWAFTASESWARAILELGCQGVHVLPSIHARTPVHDPSHDHAPVAFLPNITMSSLGLVVMLGRWAFLSSRRGGLNGMGSKAAARDLLEGLVRGQSLTKLRWTFKLVFSDSWAHVWPRTQPSGDVTLPIAADSSIDLSIWIRMAENLGSNSIPAIWLSRIWKALGAHCNAIMVVDLMELLLTAPSLLSLKRQFIAFVATSMEIACMHSFKKGQSHPNALKIVPLDLLSLFSDRKALDHQLLKHVSSGVAVFEDAGYNSYFCATDKASVGGLSLNNIFWTLPYNGAILGCPQVSHITKN